MFIDSNIQYLYETLEQYLHKISTHYKWNKLQNEPLDIDLEEFKANTQNYGFFRSYVLNDKMFMMGEYKMVIPDIIFSNGSIDFIKPLLKVGDGFNSQIIDNILYISYSIKYTPEPFKITTLAPNFLLSFINISHFYLILLDTLIYYEKLLQDDFGILYNHAYTKNREFLNNLLK